MSEDTCENCRKKGTKKCVYKPTHWCSDHVGKTVCPLPRIGSKEWGWTRSKVDKYSSTIYTTRFGRYFISEFNSIEIYKENDNYPIADLTDLNAAKRIAELLARRDWRRENRGKR